MKNLAYLLVAISILILGSYQAYGGMNEDYGKPYWQNDDAGDTRCYRDFILTGGGVDDGKEVNGAECSKTIPQSTTYRWETNGGHSTCYRIGKFPDGVPFHEEIDSDDEDNLRNECKLARPKPLTYVWEGGDSEKGMNCYAVNMKTKFHEQVKETNADENPNCKKALPTNTDYISPDGDNCYRVDHETQGRTFKELIYMGRSWSDSEPMGRIECNKAFDRWQQLKCETTGGDGCNEPSAGQAVPMKQHNSTP